MLRLLLRLWWLQQRRNFHKRDAFVACYIIFLYVVMGVSFFLSFTENGGELGGEDMPALLGAGIVVGMLIPDIIMKMVMKRDITAMDDYVKSRPVPEKIWNKFLLTTNLVSFWNYVLPVLMLPVFIYFLPASEVVASFFLFLEFSFVNGIYITCYRKATEWILKWPLILGWMGMFAVLIGYMFVASFFPVWMGWAGIFFLAGAVFAGLTFYLYHEKIYNEQKQKVSRFRGFSHINLFSLQYIGTLRAKRVRTMVIMIAAIFLFDAYLFALLPAEAGQEMGDKVAMTTLYVAMDLWHRGKLLPWFDDQAGKGKADAAELLLLLYGGECCRFVAYPSVPFLAGRNRNPGAYQRFLSGSIHQSLQSAYGTLLFPSGDIPDFHVQHAGSESEDQPLCHRLLLPAGWRLCHLSFLRRDGMVYHLRNAGSHQHCHPQMVHRQDCCHLREGQV